MIALESSSGILCEVAIETPPEIAEMILSKNLEWIVSEISQRISSEILPRVPS